MSGTSSLDEEKIKYYPRSALPLDSVARFGALFSIRERWKAEEIEPFLTDIAIDSKERDKLLLKYGRALTDAGVVWYTARAKYNG
jgi:sister chromatid cohesion protein DCC1